MDCDIVVTRQKLRSAAKAILNKECLMEEVIHDIQKCSISIDNAWSSLEYAINNLSGSKLKGRVGISSSKYIYLEVPIVHEIGMMIIDIMGTALDSKSIFFSKPYRQTDIPIIDLPPSNEHDIGVHLALSQDLNHKFIGQTFTISIGTLNYYKKDDCQHYFTKNSESAMSEHDHSNQVDSDEHDEYQSEPKMCEHKLFGFQGSIDVQTVFTLDINILNIPNDFQLPKDMGIPVAIAGWKT